MDKYKLFTFHSTHHAMLMEKVLKENGYGVRLIPIPRNLSASCGLAARVSLSEFEAANELVKSSGVDVAAVYDF